MESRMSVDEKVNEILTTNGLDFEILKKRMTVEHDGTQVLTPYYGLYNSKSGNVINSVKEGYAVTQNKEIIETVVRGMDGFGNLSVQKAGSIHDGRKVFVQLAIDGYSSVGNDQIKRFVTIIDSNDGSTGLSVGIGDLTMSCQNQFYKFYASGQMKFRHTASATEKIKQMPQLIREALKESMRQIELYNKFQSTPITRELANQMVNFLLGYDCTSPIGDIPKQGESAMETLYSHIDKETSQKGLNLWGLHSSVTSWTSHDKRAPKRENGRIESIMTGTNYRTNIQSLEFAKKLLSKELVLA